MAVKIGKKTTLELAGEVAKNWSDKFAFGFEFTAMRAEVKAILDAVIRREKRNGKA